MDDADLHRKKRLAQLLAGAPYHGDRQLFISKTGLTKGRVSQLLDPAHSFGANAARSLAERLELPDLKWFERGAEGEPPPWPFVTISPDAVGQLPAEDRELVEKLAFRLYSLHLAQTDTEEPEADTEESQGGPVNFTHKAKKNRGHDHSVPKTKLKTGGGSDSH